MNNPARHLILGVAILAIVSESASACDNRPLRRIRPDVARRHAWMAEERDLVNSLAEDASLAIVKTATAGNCTGVSIDGPSVLQAGVANTPLTIKATGKRITVGAIDPVKNIGTFTVTVFEQGRPVPGAKVLIWALSAGNFHASGAGGVNLGQTPGHEHVSVSDAPTLRLAEFPSAGGSPIIRDRGVSIQRTTDSQGKFTFGVVPGWRGGVERLVVKRVGGPAGTDGQRGRSVAVRAGKFVDFLATGGFSSGQTARASTAWPFVMTGANKRHLFNHFIQVGPAERLTAVMSAARMADLSQGEQNISRDKPLKGYFWQMNDMSIEYGGVFHPDEGACDVPYRTIDGNIASTLGHHTHSYGVDFDIGLCYSNDAIGQLSGKACNAGIGRKVGLERLRVLLAQSGIGIVYEEYNHYHIRILGENSR